MTTPPSIEGLPVWAQILISILFAVGALGASFKGYFGKKSDESKPTGNGDTTTAIAAATVMDNLTMRQLSAAVVSLDNSVVEMTKAINEGTHWTRNQADGLRDVCQELHVLTLEMQRQGRDTRGWDKRNEDRRSQD